MGGRLWMGERLLALLNWSDIHADFPAGLDCNYSHYFNFIGNCHNCCVVWIGYRQRFLYLRKFAESLDPSCVITGFVERRTTLITFFFFCYCLKFTSLFLKSSTSLPLHPREMFPCAQWFHPKSVHPEANQFWSWICRNNRRDDRRLARSTAQLTSL